jgi:two-component system OmpR family sensor kinase
MRRVRSIRAQLLTWLLAGLSIAIVTATIATYVRAREEANELFDLQLKQTAASITGMPLAAGTTGEAPGAEGLVVQIWDRNGVHLYLPQPQRDAPADSLPPRQSPGFATIDTPRGAYRVYSVLAGGQLVQVGQPVAVRRELATSLALRTIVPWLIAAPLLLLIVWLAIARGLAPLTRLAAAVERRSPTQLAPVADDGWPQETVPLVDALNGLLARLDSALDAQRAFVADAAHELRSPLAALHLQAQLAERAKTAEERATALRDLRQGLARATRVVEQLLTLAREEPDVGAPATESVDLATLAREVAAELAPLAGSKEIDLGVDAPPHARVQGDPAGLRTLLGNLVDNAIRYSPREGQVDVTLRAEGGTTELAVCDSGPGIPPAERARVFERFVRGSQTGVPGSGLGLAIVRRVAERHRASVALQDGPGGKGLRVVVRFPGTATRDATLSLS